MEPTLNIDDRVLVIKDNIINLDIQSGDIIVFYNNDTKYTNNVFEEYVDGLKIWKINDQNIQLNTAIIKRVVGVGGDSVEIFEDGQVYVNEQKYIIFNINEGTNFKQERFIVPQNEIFVLGDNRPNSQDSRYIGTIPIENVIGKAIYIIFPFENFKNLNDWR